MTEFWLTFLTQQMPLFVSLLTALVGLIVTALKYKKQKYAIAMLEEQNKFISSQEGQLSKEEIDEIRSILSGLKK